MSKVTTVVALGGCAFRRREMAGAGMGKKVIPSCSMTHRFRSTNAAGAAQGFGELRRANLLRGKTYEYQEHRGGSWSAPSEERGCAARGAKPSPPSPVACRLIEAATGPLQQLNQEQRETIRVLERQLGASEEQLRVFFQIIGDAQVPRSSSRRG